ncbi:MAG: threonylcarbamoyl-AMP synthase [Anaerolineae bacterium]|nr:threonylcarbamoyl-AMP synthase [Anaerolineae bacterium]
MTIVLKIDPRQPDLEKIRQAAASLLEGNLVAFPTETVYGLGANALNRKAVERVFYAKGRPFQDPLIVHIASLQMLYDVAQNVPNEALSLIDQFWPGPLTLILPRHPSIPAEVSAGLNTVAVRMPSHPIALALIEHAGVPIAAPSANRFGHTSPTSAAHVLADLDGKIDLLIDGGVPIVGVESTVLDLTQQSPVILRPGGVTHEELMKVLDSVLLRGDESSRDQKDPMPSPGMLSRHYAPQTTLILIESENSTNACKRLISEATLLIESGKRVAILSADEDALIFEQLGVRIETIGSSQNLAQIANRLYSAIRLLDEEKMDFILVRSYGSKGLGLAILDRLRRAASKIINIE